MRLAFGALVIVALVALACGGGDDDDLPSNPGGGGAATGAGPATGPEPTQSTNSSGSGSAPTAPAAGGGSAPTGGGAPQAGADIDVCGLLTKAEVESALNLPVIDPAVVEDPPFITCSFNNVDFPPLHRVRIAILVLDNNEQAKAVFDSTKGPDSQEVSGIGDVASWSNFIATLEFVTGRYDVSVGVPPIDGQGAQAIAEELAGLVASRLE